MHAHTYGTWVALYSKEALLYFKGIDNSEAQEHYANKPAAGRGEGLIHIC